MVPILEDSSEGLFNTYLLRHFFGPSIDWCVYSENKI